MLAEYRHAPMREEHAASKEYVWPLPCQLFKSRQESLVYWTRSKLGNELVIVDCLLLSVCRHRSLHIPRCYHLISGRYIASCRLDSWCCGCRWRRRGGSAFGTINVTGIGSGNLATNSARDVPASAAPTDSTVAAAVGSAEMPSGSGWGINEAMSTGWMGRRWEEESEI